MLNDATTFMDHVAGEPSTLGEKLTDAATQVKAKVSGFGRTAVYKIDENRDAAAGGLDKAASTLHENAEGLPGGEKITSLAHATADKLTTTAGYVRDHEVNQMMADVDTLVKNNPGRSLVAAAIIGFLAGRAFSSNH